jgi:hypothetical protein
MEIQLVVVKPFAGFARGDMIADATRINEVLKGENAHSVVRVAKSTAKEG